jgi:hypothetical protein
VDERKKRRRFGAVRQLDVMAVRTWLRRVEVAGVGTTTRVRSYQLLNRAMSSAVEARYIPANPCAIRGAIKEAE